MQFELNGGFQQFIADTFHLDNASEKDKERALERLRKLYELVGRERGNRCKKEARGLRILTLPQ